MKRSLRKGIMLIIAVMALSVCFVFGASAETEYTEGYYTYTVTDGKATITDVDESISGEVVIPDMLGGYEVTVIGDKAFFNHTNFTSVIIPDTVISIGDSAFNGCTKLASITIPDSVTSIGYGAFLRTAYYGDRDNWDSLSVLYVGNHLIECALSNNGDYYGYIIKDGTKTIAPYAFGGRSRIVEITIPDSVISIGEFAFRQCYALCNITVDDNNKYYSSDTYGVLFDKEKTELIVYPENNKRTTYAIPNSVISVGEFAFYGCKLTTITVPGSVTNIGERAFAGCSGLLNIVVDDNNEYYSSDEYGVLFDKEKTEIFKYPQGNSRTTYLIPDSVISMDKYAFANCYNLTSVRIPDSVTKISESAFAGCSGLSSVTIPESVISIGDYSFNSCDSLTSVIISEGVESIGYSAFGSCDGLKNVTIGSNVIHIDCTAFSSCVNLAAIFVSEHNKCFLSDNGVLFNKDKTKILKYPQGNSRTTYMIPDSVTIIGQFAFDGCRNLISITIPDSVTKIDADAFQSCTGLTEIVIPNGVTSIGYYAFNYSFNLSSVVIPDSVTSIDDGAFRMTGLTDVYYGGTESEWYQIGVGVENELLINANIHFDYCAHTNITVYSSKDSTCTETGYTAGKYCNDCEKWILVREEIEKKPHNYESEITVQATHLAEGVETLTCECGDTYTNPLPKLENHTYETIVTPPTCTTDWGYTTYVCECGDSYVSDFVEPKGHSFGNWYVYSEASCYSDGEERRDCKNCDYYESIFTTGHIFGEWYIINEPTCMNSGTTRRNCVNCSYYEENNFGEPIGHNFKGEPVLKKKATCMEPAYYIISCINDGCSESIVTPIDGELGDHDSYIIDEKPATCTEDGYRVWRCHLCGFKETETLIGAHLMGEWYTYINATCTSDGEERKNCVNCDYFISKTIKKSEHSFTKYVSDENATCTSDGTKTAVCDNQGCNDTDTLTEEGSKKGHTYGDWYREKNPTCTETGVDRRDCVVCCAHYETRSVGTVEHNMNGEYVRAEPTCTEKGVLVTYCTECGYEKTIAIEKLPHSDNDADGICDSCGQDIAVANCSCNCHKGGFSGLIWKILRIFYKLFRIKEFCVCGVAHY